MTGLVFDDDVLEDVDVCYYRHRILKYILKYIQFFMELIAPEPLITQFKPSQIAAGIIAMSRGVLNIKYIVWIIDDE